MAGLKVLQWVEHLVDVKAASSVDKKVASKVVHLAEKSVFEKVGLKVVLSAGD